MLTKTKIKIIDEDDLRKILDMEYENSSQIRLCKYALFLAKHILELIEYNSINHAIIQQGFKINEQWQQGMARMYDVRQAGFEIHRLAKACKDPIESNALRVVGQAVATGHMKEHAMVASDYAIKVINLLYPQDRDSVKKERLWQINLLKSFV